MQHILIVEDEWIIYEGLAVFFKSKGFSVSEYSPSYKTALQHAREEHPDIALLDIDLEGTLNGIQAGKALKELYQIPLLYISNIQDDLTRELALDTQPSGYFFKSKNASNEEILTNVQLALQQQAPKKIKYIQVYKDFIKKAKDKDSTTDFTHVNIPLNEIHYLRTNPDNKTYVNILVDKTSYLRRKTIKEFEKENLLPLNFIKVNRTYIVNLFQVAEHKASQLIMGNGECIEISRLNRKAVKNRFNALFL